MSRTEQEKQGRRIRDAADARAVLEQIRQARQPLRTWCQNHGINPWSLYHWRYKLQEEPSAPGSASAVPALTFAEVRLPEVREPARYTLVLPDHLLLQLDSHFREDDLRRLLGVLRS